MQDVRVLFEHMIDFVGPPDPRRNEVYIIVSGADNTQALLRVLELTATDGLPSADRVIALSTEAMRHERITSRSTLSLDFHDRQQITELISLMFRDEPTIAREITQSYKFERLDQSGLFDQVSQYVPPNYRNARALRRSTKNHRGKKSKGR